VVDVLFKGGVLYDPAAGWAGPADILVRGKVIEAVFAPVPTSASTSTSDSAAASAGALGHVDHPVIDLGGKVILPGLVDIHVHLREPGGEEKETVASGCAAAVAGGITSVAAMPNTIPPVDDREIVTFIREQAGRADLARVYPLGAISKGQLGRELVSMEELAAAGVKGFTDDGKPVMDGGLMLKALRAASALDMPVISHCEDLSIVTVGVLHAGPVARRLGLPVILPAAEAAMVARDLLLQEEVGGKLHFAHISSEKSVALLRWARERGIVFTAEVTPHHLFLTEEAVEEFSSDAKMNPPLREAADQAALLAALQDNIIEVVATDHAPHHPSVKAKNLFGAPFGVVGLETALPLIINELVLKGNLSWQRVVEVFSLAPARVLNIPGGTLAPGALADLVIIDPDIKRTVQKADFYSKGRNTPFQGRELQGYPVLTMVDGDIKMLGGLVKGFSEDFAAAAEKMLMRGAI